MSDTFDALRERSKSVRGQIGPGRVVLDLGRGGKRGGGVVALHGRGSDRRWSRRRAHRRNAPVVSGRAGRAHRGRATPQAAVALWLSRASDCIALARSSTGRTGEADLRRAAGGQRSGLARSCRGARLIPALLRGQLPRHRDWLGGLPGRAASDHDGNKSFSGSPASGCPLPCGSSDRESRRPRGHSSCGGCSSGGTRSSAGAGWQRA